MDAHDSRRVQSGRPDPLPDDTDIGAAARGCAGFTRTDRAHREPDLCGLACVDPGTFRALRIYLRWPAGGTDAAIRVLERSAAVTRRLRLSKRDGLARTKARLEYSRRRHCHVHTVLAPIELLTDDEARDREDPQRLGFSATCR